MHGQLEMERESIAKRESERQIECESNCIFCHSHSSFQHLPHAATATATLSAATAATATATFVVVVVAAAAERVLFRLLALFAAFATNTR